MNIKVALSVFVLLAIGTGAGAQTQGSMSDEELVRSLDDQERSAALKHDMAALARLWSDQFTVNAPINQVVSGKTAVLERFVGGGGTKYSSFERHLEFVRVDGDFAFIMGRETVKPISDAPRAGLGGGQVVERRFTNIWKKEAGTWRLYARHANVIPTPVR